MKNRLIAVLFVVGATFCARGDTWADPDTGYTWTYRINDDTAEIFSDRLSTAIMPSPTGVVAIPATFGGKPLTSIGNKAFSGCSGLTSVTIPDSVTSIGEGAFSGCNDSLFDTTTIPGVVLVDGWAVGNTGSLSGNLNLTGVRGIGSSSFSGCTNLMSVTIPDSVMGIGASAFFGCSGLTSITLPFVGSRRGNSSTSESLFGYIFGISSYTGGPWPNNLNPTALQVIITDETVIGPDAFRNCSWLTSVTIPNSVTNIESYAFSGCSGITSVTIPDSVTSIGDSAFSGCSGLTSVTIPDSVTSIGDSAFSGCSGLTSVTIPDSVTSIGDEAFFGCTNLTSVTIPNSVTSIGEEAFYGCTSLTSVTIPNSVTSIDYRAFSGCSGLTSVYITDLAKWSSISFGYRAHPPYYDLYLNGEKVTDLEIPASVASIGDYTFYGCSGLTSVTIPNSVTNIGEAAFARCGGLTSVIIPDSVTSIGHSAFSDCSGLTSVTIPDSVTSLSTTAFDGCGKLWTSWYRTLANSSASGGGLPGSTTIVQQVSAPYALTNSVADRAIASVTVDSDSAIDNFVLKDGKVYDTMLYVSNTSDHEVTLSLPSGFSYKTIKGARPLAIPASSQCIISITRVAAGVFLVMREELSDVQ